MAAAQNPSFVPKILWAALLGSSVVEAAIAWFAHPTVATPPAPVMLYALSGVAVLVAVESFVLPWMFYRRAIKANRETFAHIAPRANITAESFRDAAANPDLRAAQRRAWTLYTTPMILALALSESVSLFGFVLVWVGFAPMTIAPFFVAGTLLMAIRYPSDAAVYGPVERECGVTLR